MTWRVVRGWISNFGKEQEPQETDEEIIRRRTIEKEKEEQQKHNQEQAKIKHPPLPSQHLPLNLNQKLIAKDHEFNIPRDRKICDLLIEEKELANKVGELQEYMFKAQKVLDRKEKRLRSVQKEINKLQGLDPAEQNKEEKDDRKEKEEKVDDIITTNERIALNIQRMIKEAS